MTNRPETLLDITEAVRTLLGNIYERFTMNESKEMKMRMFDENGNWTEESLRVSNEVYFELVKFIDEHPEFDKVDLQVMCHDAVNRAFLMLRAEKKGKFKVNRDMLKKQGEK